MLELGRNNEALNCYNLAIWTTKPEHSSTAWFRKGNLLAHLGNYNEAIKCYDASLKSFSSDYHVIYCKGYALYQLKKYEEAIKCYDEVISIEPLYPDAHRSKDIALSSLSD
jgi:tetratricopeptide (TPR) repeat protein